jgi:UDP-N-acetylglucosamine--N-acetylmuramyl-(pentapeptide) pyrophosphoryl-undecaprenol N-acetylglucosamine transferase
MSKDKKKIRIMITGGHSTPAFAVLDEILKIEISNPQKTSSPFLGTPSKGGEVQVCWVGEKHNQRGNKEVSAEYKIVKEKYKIKFINLVSGKLIRHWSPGTFFNGLRETFNFILGFIKSFFIILRERPDLVISFGGFTAVPIVINAKLFRKKVITHEQTIVAGLANKIIAKFADKVCITFEDSFKYYPKSKTILTGNPIRKDVFEIKSNNFTEFNKNLPIIYITGGNQGAHEINKRVFQILPDLLEIANAIHQTGNSTITQDFEKAKEFEDFYKAKDTKGKYIEKNYVLHDEIGEALNKSDLILSRAGANSVLEILALGKLSIFVPIPWASHDEQTKNARFVESLGLGKVLIQTDSLTAQEVLEVIKNALELKSQNLGFNNQNLNEITKVAKSKVKLDAAEEVVQIALNLLSA